MVNDIHYMAKSMWRPLQMSEFGYFSHTLCRQVYKIEHTTIQSTKTNFGSGMAHTEELSNFQCGTVIGSYRVVQQSKALHLSARGITTNPDSIPGCSSTRCDWRVP